MTPAQNMRAMMLAKLGVTEEQLKAMSPDERAKVEQKLKNMVKEQFAKNADGPKARRPTRSTTWPPDLHKRC